MRNIFEISSLSTLHQLCIPADKVTNVNYVAADFVDFLDVENKISDL